MKTIVFDTDCLSTFLRSDAIGLLILTIRTGHVLPSKVVEELMQPPSFRQQVTNMLRSRVVREESIFATNLEDALLFNEIRYGTLSGKEAGIGESEALVLANRHKGFIATNNTKDVEFYVRRLGIEHIRTKDLLMACVNNSKMTFTEAEGYWKKMQERTTLPQYTLEELIRREDYVRIDCAAS